MKISILIWKQNAALLAATLGLVEKWAMDFVACAMKDILEMVKFA